AGHLRDAAGRLGLDVRVTGPRDALRADGPVTITDGRVMLAETAVTWDDVRLDAAAVGTALEVRRLHARSADSPLDGQGRPDLPPGAPPAVGIQLRLDDFLAARRPEYEASVSGTLAVDGTLAAPVVTARLDVERAVIRPAEIPGGTASTRPDPTIVVVGG